MVKIIDVDSIFDNDFFDMHFTYIHDHQAQNFLTNKLLQI